MSALFFTDRTEVDIKDVVFNDAVTVQIEQFLKEYRFRDVLEQYELPVNNKMLLYGKTGCGKTMTAKAIAKVLDRKLIVVNLASIVSSKLGETAKNVATLFKEVSYHDAVLFFDEFDTLGQVREHDSRDSSEMKRVVNAILQLVDNFPSNSVLIAATNQIKMIDEALIRRFELRLEFTSPAAAVLDTYYDKLLTKYPVAFTQIVRKYDISFAEAKTEVFTQVKNNIIQAELAKSGIN